MYPISASFRTAFKILLLSSVPPTLMNTLPSMGILYPEEARLLQKASKKFSPKQATSPVDCISTPKSGSAPSSCMKENCGTLTPTLNAGTLLLSMKRRIEPPRIASAPASRRFIPFIFETNGIDLEARTLHSMTITSPPFTMYCTLNGPRISSARAIRFVYSSIFPCTSSLSPSAGMRIVASPECTPAFSTCSMIAPMSTSLPSLTASTSASFAFWMNLLMTRG